MHELNMIEIGLVSGAASSDKPAPGGKKEGPAQPDGTLRRPTPGESEAGRELNDAAALLNSLGSWIGIKVYDMTHRD